MAPLLTLCEIGFRYSSAGPWILHHLNFTIETQNRYCIIGRSGVGKSTLLRLLGGILVPTAGSFTHHKPSTAQTLATGFMFQDSRLLPWRSVFDNVLFAVERLELTKAARRERASIALEKVGASSLADCFPHTLSGGQQQRVALARALATGAELLLLDEPLSALDYESKCELRQLLDAVTELRALTIVMVTHDPDDWLRQKTTTIELDSTLGARIYAPRSKFGDDQLLAATHSRVEVSAKVHGLTRSERNRSLG